MISAPKSIPRSLGAAAEAMIGARDQAARLKRIFDRSSVPMVIIDDERRFVDVNTPARLAVRLSRGELLLLRTNDLTPSHKISAMEEAGARLTETGCVAGPYELAPPDGGRLDVVYVGVANVLPGQHLIAFAPAGWPDRELLIDREGDGGRTPSLTPRELELLELAAEGRGGPMIAEELVISPATVRTHFEHIYAKLAVKDRVAAVAKAIRLGLIA